METELDSAPVNSAGRTLGPFSVLLAAAIVLGMFTVYVQAAFLGLTFLERGTQIEHHQAVLQGTSTDPWQYRILSEAIADTFISLARWLRIPHPIAAGFLMFRVIQNVLLFVLASQYYRRLGLSTYISLIGVSLLAWGMTHSLYHSGLEFNTYSDVIFYLSAGLLVLSGSIWWMIPLTAFAALNRETSALIPLIPATQAAFARPAGRPSRSTWLVTVICVILFALIFFELRHFYGPRPVRLNPAFGIDFLTYNLGHYQSWVNLFGTMGILPIMALVSYSRWPRDLKALFWLVVPIWWLIHFTASMVDESRLFLVPHALVILPGALFGIISPRPPSPVDAKSPDPSPIVVPDLRQE